MKLKSLVEVYLLLDVVYRLFVGVAEFQFEFVVQLWLVVAVSHLFVALA